MGHIAVLVALQIVQDGPDVSTYVLSLSRAVLLARLVFFRNNVLPHTTTSCALCGSVGYLWQVVILRLLFEIATFRYDGLVRQHGERRACTCGSVGSGEGLSSWCV